MAQFCTMHGTSARPIVIPLICGLLHQMSSSAQFGPFQLIGHARMEAKVTELVDLDMDGDRDLVFPVDGLISWMPNNGEGSFWPRRTAVEDMNFLKIVDLDLDGDLDLVGERDEVMMWAVNTGDGRFPAPPIAVGACPSYHDFGHGDLDGDGDVDLFYTSFSTGVLAWFANDGSGQFGAAQIISNVASSYTCAAFDLDDDGDLDLASRIGSYNVWIPNNGDGTFAPPVQLAISTSVYQYEQEDLDNDGDDDLICRSPVSGSAGGVAWYAQESAGMYGPRQEISAWGMTHMSFRDFDLDGDLDMMGLRGDMLRRHANDGTGTFTVGTIIDANVDCFRALCEDLNHDGSVDVVGVYGGDQRMRAQTKFNDGTGNFGPSTAVGWKDDTEVKLYPGDLNSDGNEDLLALHVDNYKLSWYPGLGNGGFGLERIITVMNTTGAYAYYMYQDVSITDTDGDGDADIVLAVYNGTENVVVLENSGTGEFSAGTGLLINTTNPYFITTVDIDQDGDQDALSRYGQSGLGLSINDGSGVFASPVNVTDQGMSEVTYGDLDGDGDIDLAYCYATIITLLANTGSGWAPYADLTSPTTASNLVLQDINGDGFDDLFHSRDNIIRGYLNNGVGGMTRMELPDSSGYDLALADIDRDGGTDLVLRSYNGLRWFPNNGAGNFGSGVTIATTAGTYDRIELADIDADGDPDVLHSSALKGTIGWYENYTLAPCIIQGTIFLDDDVDGQFDATESGLPLVPVNLMPAAPALYTDGNGSYEAHVEPGTYTAQIPDLGAFWVTTTPVPLTTTLNLQDNTETGFDIGIAAAVDTSAVATEMVLGSAPCGGPTSLWLTLRNVGTRPVEGVVTLELDDRFEFIGSDTAPSSVNGDAVTWNYDDLGIFEQQTITVQVLQPSTEFMDSTWTHQLSVSTLDGLFLDSLSGRIACAYDPNDKQVEPEGYGAHGAVPTNTNELCYTIRFQNTGSSVAFNVEIRDLLDPRLDPMSVRLLAASHPITDLRVDEDGELLVRFTNIMLPDSGVDFSASQGFLRFGCRTRGTPLPHLTRIENDAAIHFDLNPPVITNTTANTWVDCALWQPDITLTGLNLLTATIGENYQWYLNEEILSGATGRQLMATSNGSYSVDVRDQYGCERRSTAYDHMVMGVGEPLALGIEVYPNPFQERITLRSDRDVPVGASLVIIDQQGRQVFMPVSRHGRELVVHRGSLAPGLYSLVILHKGSVIARMRVAAL